MGTCVLAPSFSSPTREPCNEGISVHMLLEEVIDIVDVLINPRQLIPNAVLGIGIDFLICIDAQ